jgi:glutaredoxin
LDRLEYTRVPGPAKMPDLKLYALSTCAFCRRAMKYLRQKGHEFRYVYLDLIDLELKREVKRELRVKYDSLPVFPILTIDDREAISGFAESKWAERLGAS